MTFNRITTSTSCDFDNHNLTKEEVDLITPVDIFFPSTYDEFDLQKGLSEPQNDPTQNSNHLSDIRSFKQMIDSQAITPDKLIQIEDIEKFLLPDSCPTSFEELRMTPDVSASATISITIVKIRGQLNNCYPTLDHKTRDYFHNLIKYNKNGKVKAEVKHLLELEEKIIISGKSGPARRAFINTLKKNGISTKEKTDKHLIKTEDITRLIQNLDPNFSDKKILDYFNKTLLPFCRDHEIRKVDIVNFGAEEATINLKTLVKNLKKDHNITNATIENTNHILSSISNELYPILSEPIQDDNSFQSPISQGHRYSSDILSFKQEKDNLMSMADAEAILLPNSNPTPLSLDDRLARSVREAIFDVTDLVNDEGIKKRKTNPNETPRIVSEPDVPNTIRLSYVTSSDFKTLLNNSCLPPQNATWDYFTHLNTDGKGEIDIEVKHLKTLLLTQRNQKHRILRQSLANAL